MVYQASTVYETKTYTYTVRVPGEIVEFDGVSIPIDTVNYKDLPTAVAAFADKLRDALAAVTKRGHVVVVTGNTANAPLEKDLLVVAHSDGAQAPISEKPNDTAFDARFANARVLYVMEAKIISDNVDSNRDRRELLLKVIIEDRSANALSANEIAEIRENAQKHIKGMLEM